MDPVYLLLGLAVFAAAALQSATGVGFGIIAGPALLAILNDASAIQISIILNLLIAGLLAPSVWPIFDNRVMARLVAGVAIGSPLGFVLFMVLPLIYLKLLVGVFVLFTLFMVLFGERILAGKSAQAPSTAEQVVVGAIGGTMGASLAIPGPIPAAWMLVRGFDLLKLRATILVMFLYAYSAALLLQIGTVGIEGQTIQLCLQLAIPTVGGIVIGKFLSERLPERLFRGLLVLALVATTVSFFYSMIG